MTGKKIKYLKKYIYIDFKDDSRRISHLKGVGV